MGQGVEVRVRGLVQGVGFRPTVWRIASELGLSGEVLNDAEGVIVRLWGDAGIEEPLIDRLQQEAPPLSRIDAIEVRGIAGTPSPGFHIVESRRGAVHTGVVPDAATCGACRVEIFDPDDRRHRYPFTNCTHCGPRLSIVRSIPYDRTNTSMEPFRMCPQCASEYRDPGDRRFHAQPNACPACGPKVWLEDATGRRLESKDPIRDCALRIGAGAIVAVKGIGGFHLACDATNEQVVAELRRRKRRQRKAFALMARDADMVRQCCELDEAGRALLEGSAAPILVLYARSGHRLAPSIAPGQHSVGFMLPYTPLHHLLMAELAAPIVLTSGNLSEEPQCIDNDEARQRLGGIAELFLMHDREIVNRVDDSVVRMIDGAPRLLRRARGYAPAPLPLAAGFRRAPPLLAMGADLKNSFCLLRDGQAILSQHLGDLSEASAYEAWRETLGLYTRLFDHRPQGVVVDLHPGYLSTRYGRELGERLGVPVVEVQHHHAHVAATLAEHGYPPDGPKVLGIALDGLGFGDDGQLWGCELLLADLRSYRRLGALWPAALLGGDRASREPWRNIYARLRQTDPRTLQRFEGTEVLEWLATQPTLTLDRMLERGINSPLSSSAGRLFDAVAAAVGICRDGISYEGEAAIELEQLLRPEDLRQVEPYPFALRKEHGVEWLDPLPLWSELLADLQRGQDARWIAARFHAGFADALIGLAGRLARSEGTETIALSGGVCQNRPLLERLVDGLRGSGFEVLSPRQVPANDGGVALGQAVIAASRGLG